MAIRRGAGNHKQWHNSVALGNEAGSARQGSRSAVAIGNHATSQDQAANSMVINSTGSSLLTTDSKGLHIQPVESKNQNELLPYHNNNNGENTYHSGAVDFKAKITDLEAHTPALESAVS